MNIKHSDMKAVGYIAKVCYLYSLFTFPHISLSLSLFCVYILGKADNYGSPKKVLKVKFDERFLGGYRGVLPRHWIEERRPIAVGGR